MLRARSSRRARSTCQSPHSKTLLRTTAMSPQFPNDNYFDGFRTLPLLAQGRASQRITIRCLWNSGIHLFRILQERIRDCVLPAPHAVARKVKHEVQHIELTLPNVTVPGVLSGYLRWTSSLARLLEAARQELENDSAPLER